MSSIPPSVLAGKKESLLLSNYQNFTECLNLNRSTMKFTENTSILSLLSIYIVDQKNWVLVSIMGYSSVSLRK